LFSRRHDSTNFAERVIFSKILAYLLLRLCLTARRILERGGSPPGNSRSYPEAFQGGVADQRLETTPPTGLP